MDLPTPKFTRKRIGLLTSGGDSSGMNAAGGTLIRTARCQSFREHKGRLRAAYNLIKNGIDALIVCGGDGTLTEEVAPHAHLTIVGIVCSIDNDMAKTDITIGAVTSLHRICEAIDNISSTAFSHSRAFVIEVMGRHCDYVFIPERPPEAEKWKKEMRETIEKQREAGKRNTIIIVAEGAIDDNLQPIKCEDIRKLLTEVKIDTRVTTLGHIQRGGFEAVKAVLRATPDTPSPMISVRENKLMCEPLMEAVELVSEAIAEKNFRRAMELRDPEFAQGMNAATRAAVRVAINHGHKPIAIYNGFAGLLQENVRELHWLDVDDWTSKGGSELGTTKTEVFNLDLIAHQLQKQGINALLLIGGFEAYSSLIKLNDARDKYPAFCIPMVCIPATISNNVPGTEFSLGCDTSLNAIVDNCDILKQSASASRRRVFVVEVHGGYCGYLAVMAGLAVGATNIYSPEYGLSLQTLQEDLNHLVRRFGADKNHTSSGRKGLFDSRTSILGHIQQGGAPSPMDRIRATKFAVECVSFLEKHAKSSGSSDNPRIYTKDKESAAVIGINGAK
ncbi:20110_t:CDS:10, partial [Racocetra fulgida]